MPPKYRKPSSEILWRRKRSRGNRRLAIRFLKEAGIIVRPGKLHRNYRMGKTVRVTEVAYLDPEKKALLIELAKTTRIAKAVLVREAIDNLLIKYGVLSADSEGIRSDDPEQRVTSSRRRSKRDR